MSLTLPTELWPEVAEALTKPWPEAAAVTDLGWWCLQREATPSRRRLAMRWGWTEYQVRHLLDRVS